MKAKVCRNSKRECGPPDEPERMKCSILEQLLRRVRGVLIESAKKAGQPVCGFYPIVREIDAMLTTEAGPEDQPENGG